MKLVLSLVVFFPLILQAHFQMLLPSKAIVEDQKDSKIEIIYKFTHPFERSMMHMEKPISIGVFYNNKRYDMSTTLEKKSDHGKEYWKNTYNFKEPNVYQFYVDPKPCFEPTEGKFIRHQTKVVIDAFESSEGWNQAIGLKAEIIPYTRPYGLYAGNIFSAKVLYKGKPAKNVEVEIELYNEKGYEAPTSSHITQVVKTDEQGVFHFVMPKSGWWGFAALIDDDETIKKNGKEYPIELGALIWIKCEDMK